MGRGLDTKSASRKALCDHILRLKMRSSIFFLGILEMAMEVLANEPCAPGTRDENLALNVDVYPSSEILEGSSRNAIDGKLGTCFETEYEKPSWLALDLKKNYRIVTVVVRSSEHIRRLDGAEVRVGKSLGETEKCQTIRTANTPNIIICCYGMEGRYVTIIMKQRKEYLSFCEVEVYGLPVNDDLVLED